MKYLKVKNDMDSKQKLILSLFWTNRKGARAEGCAPFLVKKITTEKNVYTPEEGKALKLSDPILNDILGDMESGKKVNMEIELGEEVFNATIGDDCFAISTKKDPELEDEIIEKLESELNRKYPNFCETFIPRVMPQS
ncbi:MAG: hypothetical protein QME14_00190 [Methanobacteriaceae archaeon]|nr:hypothetical protein [Methanobacteriaceae archaeon]